MPERDYSANFALLKQKLSQLDNDVETMCSSASLPYFIIYHPALTYLARDYNLEQVAIENEGKEPSAKRIAEIIERGRRSGVKRVFYQSEFPQSSVGVVAEDIGAEAVEINPLDEDVFSNIRHITTLITE
jgi:zinc transport system substrate-binding protein